MDASTRREAVKFVSQTISRGNGTVLAYTLYWYTGPYSHGATDCAVQQSPESWIQGDQRVPVFSVFSVPWFQLQEKTDYRKAEESSKGCLSLTQLVDLLCVITRLRVFALFLHCARKVVIVRNKGGK